MFKRMSLELGGKNPVIVCEDADLEKAMPHIVRSAFSNQGQICLCGSRILVHRERLEEFMQLFIQRVKALKVGDPLDPESDQGALVSQEHLEKVESYVQLAVEEGVGSREVDDKVDEDAVADQDVDDGGRGIREPPAEGVAARRRPRATTSTA